MPLKFYCDKVAEPCRAVYMFLKMNDIPFEMKFTSLIKAEHHTDEFHKINPFQQVPAIDDDGFHLTESTAIIQYLARKHKTAAFWYPDDLQQQARIDEYLNWHHANIRHNHIQLFMVVIFKPIQKREPVTAEEIAPLRKALSKSITEFGSYFLKDRAFIAGDEISIADLICVCDVTGLLYTDAEDLFQSNPVVNAWVERVKKRLQPHYDDACEPETPWRKTFLGKFSTLGLDT